ncbi:glycosyltransferase family 2 protein [bacterium]|nr:glycosyltransferase family 2 protein [bacterium]
MNAKKPLISVIIPTYNRAHFLPRAINSVLNQTYKNFELIIVDDGSTDETRKIIKKFLKKDLRIKYIYQKNSGGPSKPKNTGIQICKGEYIAFLDSDDEWFANKLEKQIKKYIKNNKNNNIGIVGCGAIRINTKNKKTKKVIPPRYVKIKSSKVLNKTIPHSCSSVMIKKSVFKKIGLFDNNIKTADDYEIYIRISRRYNFLFIREPLFNYYIHEDNISKPNSEIDEEKIKEKQQIIKKHKKIFSKYPRAYSNEFKKIGTFKMLTKDYKNAKKYFIKSIKINPFSRVYINLFLSFTPKLYKKILFLKKSK